MNAYDVVIDPTVITACVACNFTSSSERQLIVGKATILEVYEVLKIKQPQPSTGFDFKLKLVDSYKLQGLITTLKHIRTAENPDLDYILVSTKSAKVSCIKWDTTNHSISTVSLHFYEHALQNTAYEKIYETELLAGFFSRPLFCLRRKNLLVFLPFSTMDDDEDDDSAEISDSPKDPKNRENYLVRGHRDGTLYESNENMKIELVAESNEKAHDNGDSTRTEKQSENPVGNSTPEIFDTSTIIDAVSLDPSVGDIIDFQFLYNYREPTVAVISQQRKTWSGLLSQERDNVTYSVWSLDIASSSATTVLKIGNLPFDIHRIVPLSSPLNGSLLVGCNELIHIDNGGIARRVALNSYVSDTTNYMKDFSDHSSRELKLEDCSIACIPNDCRVMIILKTGDMYMITFDVDGKIIKGLNIAEIDPSFHEDIRVENPGSIIALDENLLFVVGKSSDSVLLEISDDQKTIEDTTENAKSDDSSPLNHDHDDVEYDDDDDDLYGDDEKIGKRSNRKGPIRFIKHEAIRNNGPISSFALGKYSPEKFVANLVNPSYNEVSIFAAGGVGESAHLNIMTPTVQPIIRSSLRFSQINRLWIIRNKYLITSDDSNQKSEIFDINRSYARIPSTHFINNELTIAMHELDKGKFILQVTSKQILLFNEKLKVVVRLKEQLAEFGDAYIVNSVFNDDFLMIFFSTGEVVIFSINTYNKTFTKIELPKLLSETIITTGYITNSRLLNVVSRDISVIANRGQKRKRKTPIESSLEHTASAVPKSKTFVLVTGDNRIVVFGRFHNEKCFQLNSVNKFSNRLSLGFFDINGADPDPFIKQVILNDLGDDIAKDEYLTILTVGGEIHIYKMYLDDENYNFVKEVNLPITGAPDNAYPYGTSVERRMIYFPNVNGHTCVMVTGVTPYFITRSRHSLVRIHKFSKLPIISFVSYSDDKIKNGLIYLDTKKNARIIELPEEFNYEHNWPMRRIHVGETIKSVAYHESSHTLTLSTFKEIPYSCLDESGNPVVGTNSEKASALSYKGHVHLISPLSWTSIDSFTLEDNEVGLQVKSLSLDIGSDSKRFKRKKELILLGTGKYRMEDLASNGSYHLLEIIDIIPEPDKPETNHKFKEITQEDTRGAVTAICDVSGRFLIAQGQKVIVRDIKDSTAVPVAFMDLSVFISEAKSFGNLLLFGDTLKSVTLAGFDAEPFRMIFLGKDTHRNDVCCADFIFKDEEIFLLLADNDKVIHVLQYNPEDPASANGQRLLRKSSFNTNLSTTCMKSIPKHENTSGWVDPANVPLQTIASTAEGAMYIVFPINEASFRRMFVLQQQLMEKEYHHCGLNPRSNRVWGQADPDQTLRPILDCELLKRFAKLDQDRRRTLSQKISIKSISADIWRDLIEFENVLSNL